MAGFSYTARDKKGAILKGTIFAGDRPGAAAALLDKGLVPILVKEAATGGAVGGWLSKLKFGDRVKLGDKVIFSRQFATMINSGVPIAQSLAILKEQTHSKKFQSIITDIDKKVEGGASLASALGEHPEVFPPVYVNMVRAGETAGILDQVMDRLATQQEKDAEIVSKVRGAMIYPSVITVATFGAFFFLMTVIVPKLAVIFEGLGTELPIYTKIMLGTSKFLTKFGVFIIIGLIGLAILAFRYTKTKPGKKILDTILLKLPIFGPIIRKVNVARFGRTFGSLMSAGVSVLESINTTASALNNSIFKEELAHIASEVKAGKSVSEPLRKSRNFPPIVAQMAAVGEETGQLDVILIKVATFYEKEVDNVVSNITSVIEPILIIVLGAMIGSIVISIFGPLSDLSSSV